MTRKKKKILWLIVPVLALLAVTAAVFLVPDSRWEHMDEQEKQLRLQYIETAKKWLGSNEADGSHREIIDLYNSHRPLAQGYTVKYTDSWCATFVSAAAIACGIVDILPTECGCQRQIGLFQAIGRWEERDSYKPLPGDIIYYCSGDNGRGDCTGWSDHVGIVTEVNGPLITVLEGNYDDCVQYRQIFVNAPTIRGYGLPDYGSIA